MLIVGRCWTTSTSWQELPLNFPAAQTKCASVSHALSHGLGGSEGPCLLTPSCSQWKKSPQEGSLCTCWCGKKQREVRQGKNTQISPHANVPRPSLVVSPLPFPWISNSSTLNAFLVLRLHFRTLASAILSPENPLEDETRSTVSEPDAAIFTKPLGFYWNTSRKNLGWLTNLIEYAVPNLFVGPFAPNNWYTRSYQLRHGSFHTSIHPSTHPPTQQIFTENLWCVSCWGGMEEK